MDRRKFIKKGAGVILIGASVSIVPKNTNKDNLPSPEKQLPTNFLRSGELHHLNICDRYENKLGIIYFDRSVTPLSGDTVKISVTIKIT